MPFFFFFSMIVDISGEGCGVTVEGSASITEEAIATPPVGDTKASAFFLILIVHQRIFLLMYSSVFAPFTLLTASI
jgi:hypothetical protein